MAENKEQKNIVKEIRVSLQGLHLAPRKVRLLAGPLRNLPVYHAQDQLKFMVQKGVKPLAKLIASGVSAAQNDHQVEPERLYIKSLTADGGQVAKRFKPRAQGRAFPIRRRTSHINLVLGISEKALTEKRASEPKKKETPKEQPEALDPKKLSQKAPEVKPETAEKKISAGESEPKGNEDKSSWFNPFGKQGKSDETQVKKDIKGKQQKQTFDRRGNM